MKKMAKKCLCLLSGAVLLCGATGMSASASDTSRTTGSAESRPTYAVTTTSNSSSSTRRQDTTTSQRAMFLINAASITLNYNESYDLTVVQSSSYKLPQNGVLTYQWYKDGTAVKGASSKTYPVSEEGRYFCKVIEKIRKPKSFSSNRIQYVINNEYTTNTVTVNAAPFKIAAQPKSGALSGGKYTTSVAVKGGTAPYSYEWYKCSTDRRVKDRKVSSTQSLPATSAGKYYCKITDSKGREIRSDTITVKNERLMAVRTNVVKSGSCSYIDYKITGGSGSYSFDNSYGTYNPRSGIYTIKADNYVKNSREGTTIPTPDGLQSDYWIVLDYYAYVNFTVKDADGQTVTVNEKVTVSTIRQHDSVNADYDYNRMYGGERKESEIEAYRY